MFGILYGNTFRSIKGSDERDIVRTYTSRSAMDFHLEDRRQWIIASSSNNRFYIMAERCEIPSSLAVVVSNYEALATYEEGYGLQDNIWRYTWTAFIPRFLWKDKPTIADNCSYNELYSGYGGFGLAITAMGDLLRNFGPFGVPIGMFVLGFLIRIFYATLSRGAVLRVEVDDLFPRPHAHKLRRVLRRDTADGDPRGRRRGDTDHDDACPRPAIPFSAHIAPLWISDRYPRSSVFAIFAMR